MNKLIIDAANEKILLMIIGDSDIYSISHENSKTNFEKLTILINNFLSSKNLKINDITLIYLNRGPGSYAGIRNSLSIVKAIHLALKIDYYCYSYLDFSSDNNLKYSKFMQ